MLRVENYGEFINRIAGGTHSRLADSERFDVLDVSDLLNATAYTDSLPPTEYRSGIVSLAPRDRLDTLGLFRTVPTDQSRFSLMAQAVRKRTFTQLLVAMTALETIVNQTAEDELLVETEGANTVAFDVNGVATFAGDAPGFFSNPALAVGVEIAIGTDYFRVTNIAGDDDASQVITVDTNTAVVADNYKIVNRNRAAIAANGRVTFSGRDIPGFVSNDALAVGVEIKIGNDYYPISAIAGATDAAQAITVTTAAVVAVNFYSIVNRNRAAIAANGRVTFTGRDIPGFVSNADLKVGTLIRIAGNDYKVDAIDGATDAAQEVDVDHNAAVAADFYSVRNELDEVRPYTEKSGMAGQPEFKFQEESEKVISIPAYLEVPLEVFEDTPMLEALLQNELRSIAMEVLQNQVISGDGNAPNMVGLNNWPNLGSLAETNNVSAILQDRIPEAWEVIQKANVGIPTGIILHASLIQELIKLFNVNNATPNVLSYDARGNPMLYGRHVVFTSAIPSDRAGYVADFRQGLVAYRKRATIEVSRSHSDNFGKVIVTIRIWLRAVLFIQRAKAFQIIPWSGAAL